eukprot:scaffold1252_cov124-Isochrysis_galbana.AAC.11
MVAPQSSTRTRSGPFLNVRRTTLRPSGSIPSTLSRSGWLLASSWLSSDSGRLSCLHWLCCCWYRTSSADAPTATLARRRSMEAGAMEKLFWAPLSLPCRAASGATSPSSCWWAPTARSCPTSRARAKASTRSCSTGARSRRSVAAASTASRSCAPRATRRGSPAGGTP